MAAFSISAAIEDRYGTKPNGVSVVPVHFTAGAGVVESAGE